MLLAVVVVPSAHSFQHSHASFVTRKARSSSATPPEVADEPAVAAASEEFSNPVAAVGDLFGERLYAGGRGERIKYGVFKEAVAADELAAVDPKEAARRRARASEELTNIDDAERARRKNVGLVGSAATLALACALPAVGVPFPNRFAGEIFPVFLSLGFLASAEEGL